MSGWLEGVTGYAVLTAMEYQKHMSNAEQQIDAAMRAASGPLADSHLHYAKGHLRKAIAALETIQFDVKREH